MKTVLIAAVLLSGLVQAEPRAQVAGARRGAAARQDYRRFAGRYPHQMFKSMPTLKGRLRRLFDTEYEYQKFMHNLSVQSPFEVTSGFLVGRGMPPQGGGGDEEAVMLVSPNGDALLLAIRSGEYGGQYSVFTDTPERMPYFFLEEAAAAGYTQTIRLRPGAVSATIPGRVLSGKETAYRFKARRGQSLSLSLEGGGGTSFQIYAVKGDTLIQEATNWEGRLPETNDYVIVVTPDGGDSDYSLKLVVR